MNRGNRQFYFILTLLFSCITLAYYFGELFERPNSTFFGPNGDGLLTYYTSVYHVKYDTLYFHQDAINYPFGESVFFTGCQPMLTNTIRIIKPILDVTNYVVGITNMLMLLSIVLSALFLYLIFQKLKLPGFYSAVCSTAIAFLSPQIARLGGHYTLTYQFAIPGIIYFIMLFAEKPNLGRSVLISGFVFLMASTHIYFFAFFSLLIVIFFANQFTKRAPLFLNWKQVSKHLLIQIILPYLAILLLIQYGNHISDRTQTPYGFLVYKSSPGGVFWPSRKPYFEFMDKIYSADKLEWEGIAYVGIAASLFFILFLLSKLRTVFQKQKVNFSEISDNSVLNSLFFAAVISLLISFGLPFILGLENLLNYFGPIKQFRGIARFAWNFYYIINIVMVYVIYKKYSLKEKPIAYAVFSVLLLLLLVDMHRNVRNFGPYLNNQKSNWLEKIDQDWLNKLNPKHYQALLPLPYFHIGSEDVSFEPTDSNSEEWAMEVSIKTGVPLFAVHASRTSLSQTYACIPIVLAPLAPFPFLKKLPNSKPFLITTDGLQLNENETRILKAATLLFETTRYKIYELSLDSIQHLQRQYAKEIEKSGSAQPMSFIHQGFSTNEALNGWYFNDFEDRQSTPSFAGKGAKSGELTNNEFEIFQGTLPDVNHGNKYVFSFWMYNFKKDLYPRSILKISHQLANENNEKCQHIMARKALKAIVGDWALLEDTVSFYSPHDSIRISIFNNQVVGYNPISVDNFLLRPYLTNIYYNRNGVLWFNNRQIDFNMQ